MRRTQFSEMRLKERYDGIIGWFTANRPDAASELHFDSPYQLLVAVMLSAQCTDKRVNMVTPAVFRAYPDPASLATADRDALFSLVKSVSYPNSKTEHLLGMARKVTEDFSGKIPDNIQDLQKLPGVGRKTANVVASICFGAQVIAVDTHVFRVAHRLGLSDGGDVRKVEEDLTKNITAEFRARAHHWLILHGRYICTARNPKCISCGLAQWCKEWNNKK